MVTFILWKDTGESYLGSTKKSGITMVKNDANGLIPTYMQTGWRVWIDYRKLNASTKNDHLSKWKLQLHQISIAHKEPERITFTCLFGTFANLFGTFANRCMPFVLCYAVATFKRCMVSIFTDMVNTFIDPFGLYLYFWRFIWWGLASSWASSHMLWEKFYTQLGTVSFMVKKSIC